MIARAALAAAATAALAPAAARADDATPATPTAAPADAPDEIRPDPRARRMAAEANLEPARRREGLAFGIALGPAQQVAFAEALNEASGTGGSLDLRVGTSASERLAWFVDLFAAGTPRQGDTGTNKLNQTTVLGAGVQLFVLESLWIRGGAGLAHLELRSEQLVQQDKTSHWGLGAFGGGGLDLLRRGRFALDGEVQIVSGVYAQGLVSALVFQLGATWW